MDSDLKNRLEYEYGLELTGSGIKKLNYYLNYNLSGTLLFIASYFVPFFTLLLVIASTGFSFYMLFVLIKNRKYGWVISFFVSILIPILALGLLFPLLLNFGMGASIFIGVFFLYCMILKMTTRDWVAAEDAKKDLYEMRRRKQLEMDLFNRQIPL